MIFSSIMNHSFEPILVSELVESVHQICLNLSSTDQNSIKSIDQEPESEFWLSYWSVTWLEMSQNSCVSNPMMNESFGASVPPTVTELRKQFDSGRRQWAADMNTHEPSTWIKGPNQRFDCFSSFTWKGELMETSLFPLYALETSLLGALII